MSWNSYDGTNNWKTPGGDYLATPADTRTITPTNGWQYFYPTSLVQSWMNGSAPNYGVMLKESTETTNNVLQFDSYLNSQSNNWPTLTVQWQQWLGSQPFYTMVGGGLASINAANGNLVATETFGGITATYNSESNASFALANRWSLNVGSDVGLTFFSDGSADFNSPDGLQIPFTKSPSTNTFTGPPWLPAILTETLSGTYQLTLNQSQQVYNFSTGGVLTTSVDRNGNTTTYNYSGTELQSIVDPVGRVTTFGYSTSGYIDKIVDPANRSWTFVTNSSGNLAQVTDPMGYVTKFLYNSLGDLAQITDPDGHISQIGYTLGYNQAMDATSTTAITNTSKMSGLTTQYQYYGGFSWGASYVIDPENNQSSYTFEPPPSAMQAPRMMEDSSYEDANDNIFSETHNLSSAVTSMTDALSNSSTITYGSQGLASSVQGPKLSSTDVAPGSYTAYLLPNTVTVKGYQYLPSSTTDPQQNCTGYFYDANGNVTQVEVGQPAGVNSQGVPVCHSQAENSTPYPGYSVTTNTYEGDPGVVSCGGLPGQICSTTDPNGNTTTYSYDQYGNQIKTTPPSPLGSTTAIYDPIGRVTQTIDGQGNQTNYTYNADDQTIEITYGGERGSRLKSGL